MSNPNKNAGLLGITFIAFVLAGSLAAQSSSQVRIVRLSDVRGAVEIDKNSGAGYEKAFMNMPITEGCLLRTQSDGKAEVEFDDGSALRLTPDTTVEFKRLGSDEGKHISEANLTDGEAYVSWQAKHGDALTLNFSRQKITLLQSAHFRVQTTPARSEVAVFKGDVEVVGPAGSIELGKRKMATFDSDKGVLAKFEAAPYDDWDKQADEYHSTYTARNSTPFGYGASDLSYYGTYSNVPGYGMLWQPFFAGVGWNPYMDGAWAFYPGAGYMWVSAYPWGWTPYMYGNWLFVPGAGWMWQPGGWNSWNGTPRFVGTSPQHFSVPTAPTVGRNTVTVGNGGPVRLGTPFLRGTQITQGSAGRLVPRGSINNLAHLNRQVAKSGSVELRSAPVPYSGGASRPLAGQPAYATPAPMHSAPPMHSSGGGMRPH